MAIFAADRSQNEGRIEMTWQTKLPFEDKAMAESSGMYCKSNDEPKV